MNSPWTVRTTPAVSVHMRVAFRRGRGICGCIELIRYQITKAPAGNGGGLVLSGLRRCDTTKEDNMLEEFSMATECGFGRPPSATIPQLLRIHAEIGALP